MSSTLREQLRELDKIPSFDPKGISSMQFRDKTKVLMRSLVERVEELEAWKQGVQESARTLLPSGPEPEWYTTGQPRPRDPADGDWKGD